MTESKTLFDIATKPFDWWAIVPPLGLLLFGIAITWMKKKNFGVFAIKTIGYVLCCVGTVVAIYIWVHWKLEEQSHYRSLVTGLCSVVEGRVENFHPMPFEGHSSESFTVGGATFSYSDYIVTPCFNNTTSHGGPIREGLRLRVHYLDDCIVQIELVEEQKAGS
jgi:hypothetical protein